MELDQEMAEAGRPSTMTTATTYSVVGPCGSRARSYSWRCERSPKQHISSRDPDHFIIRRRLLPLLQHHLVAVRRSLD